MSADAALVYLSLLVLGLLGALVVIRGIRHVQSGWRQ